MEVREILEQAGSEDLRDLEETIDGELIDEGPAALSLDPPLNDAEVEDLEARVGKLPAEVRHLLELAGGFSIGAFEIRFDRDTTYPLVGSLVPSHFVLGDDGTGNAWIVETGGRGHWGPVWFACHDPPSLVLQGTSLGMFVQEILNHHRPDATRGLVTEGVLFEPHDLPSAGDVESRSLEDALAGVPKRARVFDARRRSPGEGFPLGGFGQRVRRLDGLAAFAIDRASLVRRVALNLLGWAAACGLF